VVAWRRRRKRPTSPMSSPPLEEEEGREELGTGRVGEGESVLAWEGERVPLSRRARMGRVVAETKGRRLQLHLSS
jgi:hypothetical protein